MGELLNRGYQVTVFCPDLPKYKDTLHQWGLDAVRVVCYQAPPLSNKSTFSKAMTIFKGGPLASFSKDIFPAMIADYTVRPPPLAVIADFFATSALDAADYLSVPAISLFPNPLGATSLRAPHLRGWLDLPSVWTCLLGEAVLARFLLVARNFERSQRAPEFRMPALIEQDVYPSLSMTRPTLALTAPGLEFAYPHSPLLKFIGPSPPCNFLTRNPYNDSPQLFEWLDKQEYVVYVAFGTMHCFTDKSVNILYQQLLRITQWSQNNTGKAVSILWSLPSAQQNLLKKSCDDSLCKFMRFEEFVPQWDVLASPKVVAFVSHCGANSLYESLLNGTPLICCPANADQPANAARVEGVKAGVFPREGFNGVECSLQEVLTDLEFYTENVNRIRRMFEAQGGVIAGADFVEGIISCGAKRLTPHESFSDRYSWKKWCCLSTMVLVGYFYVNNFM